MSDEYQIITDLDPNWGEGNAERSASANLWYHEGDKKLSMSLSVSQSREPDRGLYYERFASATAAFQRFDPPHNDTMIDPEHWKLIEARVGERIGIECKIYSKGYSQQREAYTQCFVDFLSSGQPVYKENGLSLILLKRYLMNEKGEGHVEFILEKPARWDNGSLLTDRELKRARSYLLELFQERIARFRFIDGNELFYERMPPVPEILRFQK